MAILGSNHYSPSPSGCQSVHRFIQEGVGASPIAVVGGHWGHFREESGQYFASLFSQGQSLDLSWQGDATPRNYRFGQPVVVKFSSKCLNSWQPGKQLNLSGEVEWVELVPGRDRWRGSIDEPLSRHHQFQNFLRDIRKFFLGQAFAEVVTPSLVKCPGMEVELEPFGVDLKFGQKVHRLFLPTSPELHLKKLLARGFSEIFEIKTCYRNEEISATHSPEFLMLEWYRSFSDLGEIGRDLTALVKYLSSCGHGEVGEITEVTMADLFLQHLGVELTSRTSRKELWDLAQSRGHGLSEEDSWDDLFHRLFVAHIDEKLPTESPLIIKDFPPTQAALARIEPSGWAGRFELYWKGLEIANAFHELNDPIEQARRFELEVTLRLRRGKSSVPVDEGFLEALNQGLPPSGGIALGLERLFMAFYGVKNIADLRLFSLQCFD